MRWREEMIGCTDAFRIMLAFLIFIFSIIMSHDINKYFGNIEASYEITDNLGGKYILKQVAITFDDGPHEVYTKKLIEGLKERDVKATFFLTGCNIEGKESLVKEIYNEGHLIGCHTYNHVDLTQISVEAAVEEVSKDNKIISEITGVKTEYIRPPFGSWNKELEESINMKVIKWDVDPLDWSIQNTDAVVCNVVNNVENGDIILLHDIFETSVDAAFRIIDILKERGYKFVTVDKLIEY